MKLSAEFADILAAIDGESRGKNIPVHCIVEFIVPEESGPHPRKNRVIVDNDTFAIIPGHTQVSELLQVALFRMGYPNDLAYFAKGFVGLKHWNRLPLDKIVDDPAITVGLIWGELTSIATLHIEIVRSRQSTILEIKDKLLRLLLLQSHSMLLSSGCPLDEVGGFLTQICRGQNPTSEPNDETKRRFEQWLAVHQQPTGVHQMIGAAAVPPPPHPSPSMMGHHPSMASLPRPTPHFGDHRRLPISPTKLESLAQHPGMPDHMHPALQTVQSQYPTQKTRMRTSFDPELELPKLQRWFAENQHPSRHQIQQYVKELNALDSRRGRKPLDVNNVVYWFKNARAAQKRAELRLHMNGYSNGPLGLGGGLGGPNHHMHLGGGMPVLKSPPMSHNEGSLSDGEEADLRRMHQIQTSPYSLVTNSRNSLLSHLARSGRDEEESDDDLEEEEDSSNPTPSRNSSSPHANQLETMSNEQPLQLTCNKDDDQDKRSEPDVKKEASSPKEEASENEEDQRPNTAPSSLHAGSPDDGPEEEEIHRPPSRNSDFGPGALVPRTPGAPLSDRGFPLVPNNNLFSHSIMYMSHYIPSLQQQVSAAAGLNLAAAAAAAHLAVANADDRRKRNRTFIDPVTEVPRLEQWFGMNTHPSHNLILKYTEELNRMAYRQKFPKLEPKNVQFWFKNRRAKCKRLKMTLPL
ncbi:uncharacterized protein dve isoform X3 [Cloeon dipterum]|uniref:uncharacterized protein dve isoform X3 n=1 Tax=Cloeon dipterum TaxID=197152 RepID=UPI003220404C